MASILAGSLALAARLLFLIRIDNSLLWGTLVADSRSYWEWSSAILTGSAGSTGPFFLAPLYPYFLAAIRTLVGSDLFPVLAAQLVLASVGVGLLAHAVGRLTTTKVGVVVGLLAAVSGQLIFFDSMILGESLLIFLGSLLLWCSTLPVLGKRPIPGGLLLGAIVGLMALGRGTHLLLLPALAVLPMDASGWRPRAARFAAACAAAALMCSPSAIHNWQATGRFIPLTYSAGFNLAVGQGPRANGTFTPPEGAGVFVRDSTQKANGGSEWDGSVILSQKLGRPVGPAESSDYWLGYATDAFHANPVRAIRLTGLKALMLLNRREYPQIENPATYRALIGPIGVPVLGGFTLLLILACIGVVASSMRDGQVRWHVAYLSATGLGILPFFVTDRYRLHLIPALLMLAGFGVHRLVMLSQSKDPAKAARPIIWGAGIALSLAFCPLPASNPAREQWGVALDLGERAFNQGQYAVAAQYLASAAGIERRAGSKWSASEVMTAPLASHARLYGQSLMMLGRAQEAQPWLRRADTLLPSLSQPPLHMPAAAGSERASLKSLGISLAQQSSFSRAESVFTVLAKKYPDETFAWGALIRIQIILGRVSDARATLARGDSSGWVGTERELHAAFILAVSGHGWEATNLLNTLPTSEIERDPTLRNLRDVVQREARLQNK